MKLNHKSDQTSLGIRVELKIVQGIIIETVYENLLSIMSQLFMLSHFLLFYLVAWLGLRESP